MQFFNRSSRSVFRPALGMSLLGLLTSVACVEDPPGLPEPTQPGEAGAPPSAAGSKNKGGSGGASAGSGSGTGASASGTASAEAGAPAGGTSSVEAGGAGGEGGAPDEPPAVAGAGGADDAEPGVHITPPCPYQSAAVPPTGTGGAPAGPNVTLQVSPFVGSYLADSAGRTLYTYGADLPGDCTTPPKSLCTADCLVSWPPFDAGARVLPAELSDAGFGTIPLADGTYQTTYMGWPLYYYKTDLTLGQMTGQGKGKLWHVAELVLPSVTIMKAGTAKYLADGAGHTLYVSAADVAGGGETDPTSNCRGECLDTFEGFHEKKLSLVSSLEPLDFTVFARHGAGGLQLAYKGMPLYRAATDLKSGDMNGTSVPGFTAAVP